MYKSSSSAVDMGNTCRFRVVALKNEPGKVSREHIAFTLLKIWYKQYDVSKFKARKLLTCRTYHIPLVLDF